MLSRKHRQTRFQRLVLYLMMFWVSLLPILSAQAQQPAYGTGSGVKKLCDPKRCFANQQEKDAYAKGENCQFLEDVCKGKVTPQQDQAGAKEEDRSIWGNMWDKVAGALTYGYEFVKGLVVGMKEQVSDIVKMITNMGDVVDGLIELGKAFYKDPEGTMKMMGTMLGQEAYDTFTKATQCGAYDLGYVIGSYVTPVFAVKLATQLNKYAGKLADVGKAMRKDYGCASFAAGTAIWTQAGSSPIEHVFEGSAVMSRNDTTYHDQVQKVTTIFGREVASYRLLELENETLTLTDEHPLWVQGKGWTEASQIAADDVLASGRGDVLVVGNTIVQQPLRVYNFSVAQTPSYFVGQSQVWAHNTRRCDIEIHSKNFSKLEKPEERGYRGEYDVFIALKNKGWRPVKGSFNPDEHDTPQDSFAAWDGQGGIDGIYEDGNGNYIIVESKATGGTKKSDPEGCKGRLCITKSGRQMSDEWLEKNLEKMVPDKTEREKIIKGLSNGKTKKVYASTDKNGTIFHEIVPDGETDVKIGGVFTP